MKTFTHDDINLVIDSAKLHAKTVCDRLYNKVAEEIGGNEYFKAIIDRSFDYICDLEIQSLKEYFNMYFSKTSSLSAEEIKELIDSRMSVQSKLNLLASRGSNKKLTSISVAFINRSVIQAFVEMLAEYSGVEYHII